MTTTTTPIRETLITTAGDAAAKLPEERLAKKRAQRTALLERLDLRRRADTLVVGLWVGAQDGACGALLTEGLAHLGGITVVPVQHFTAANWAGLDVLVVASNDLAEGGVATEAVQCGVIPVMAECIAPKAVVADYDAQHETGNGFLTGDSSAWGLFGGVVRALETHRFSYDWQWVVRSCLAAKTA